MAGPARVDGAMRGAPEGRRGKRTAALVEAHAAVLAAAVLAKAPEKEGEKERIPRPDGPTVAT